MSKKSKQSQELLLQKSLIKKASYGNFNEVLTNEDASENAKMISELLSLPKYDNIIRKLQLTSGVINFVTNKSYEPLVELLIRKAFASQSSSTYSMGNDFSLPEDHFIDARSFFPAKPGLAINKLEGCLKGSPKKHDREYLIENGFDENDFKQNLDIAFPPIPVGMSTIKPSEAFEEYVQQKEQLKDTKIYRDLVSHYNELHAANKAFLFNKINEDKISKGEVNRQATTSQKRISDLKKHIKSKRALYLQMFNSIENNEMFEFLNIKDSSYSGVPERNRDGFSSWTPGEQLVDASVEVIKNISSPIPKFDGALRTFIQRLNDFNSYDEELNKFIMKTVDYLSGDGMAEKLQANPEILSNIRRRLSSLFENNGESLILTNVENSSLVMKDQQKKTTSLEVDGVLDDFSAMNSSREIKGRSKGQGASKKKMVFVTDSALGNLPKGSTVIDFNSQKIDKDEAKIILNNLLAPYAEKAQTYVGYQGKQRIVDKYGDLNSPEAKRQLNVLNKKIKILAHALGTVDEEERSRLEDVIVGMDHKSGIRRVQNAITMNVNVEDDEDGNPKSLSINSEQIMDDLLEEYNNEGLSGVKGVVVVKNTCTWDEYIKVEDSEWGGYCGKIFGAVNDKKSANVLIKAARTRLKELEHYLKMGHSEKSKEDLLTEYKAVKKRLDKALLISKNSSKIIAPFTILYGDPGSGKTIFPEALSNLLGYKYVRELRLGDQKTKWYGESNENLQNLLDAIFESKNTIFRIDEVDKQIGMSRGGGGDEQMHEATAGLMAKLQEAFGSESGMKKLKENNVHVIMSTNFPENIAQAWFQRTKGSVYEVPKPNSPENVKTFIFKWIEKQKRENPEDPLIYVHGDSVEEQWAETKKIFEALDMEQIAKTVTGSDISFRTLEGFLENLCALHNHYHLQLNAVSRGDTDQVYGMPLNQENANAAAGFAKDTGDNVDYSIGVQKVERQITTGLNEFLSSYDFEIAEETDWLTGETVQVRALPPDIAELSKYGGSGDADIDIDDDQFDVVDSDEGRTLVPTNKAIDQEFEDLGNTGFEELSDDEEFPELSQENTNELEDSEEDDENTITSSTDYYFSVLKKANLINQENKKKEVKIKKVEAQVQNEVEMNKPQVDFYDELAPYGVAYFEPRGNTNKDNYICVMPKSKRTKPYMF